MSAFSHKLGQVTYPRMERQDLTQSQLGSFKFTPTDEVRPVFSGASPRLAQQFMQFVGKDTEVGRPSPRIKTTMLSNGCSSQESPSPASSPTRLDSTFFNNFIKPDLTKSRLLLGPTALRAAVDSAPTSPHRQSIRPESCHQMYLADTMEPNIKAQQDDYTHRTTARSSTSTFAPISESPQADVSLLHTSLIRALASEQQSHQITKEALEFERNGRLKAELEAQKYLEYNRSLVGSVNMLKSVVQHTVKRDQEAAQKAVVDDFYNKVNAAGPPQTILHDAVKNLRKQPVVRAVPEPDADNSHLFDFDLLERHGSPALRKHFTTYATEAEPKVLTERNENIQPMNVVSEKAVKRDASDETWGSGDVTMSGTSDETILENGFVVVKNKSEGQKKLENKPEPENKIKSELNIKSKHDAEPELVPESKPKLESASDMMAMPFDAHVQWCHDPIFNDKNDHFDRLGYDSSIFATHPVRYLPSKSNKNLYRTVMIDFMPIGTTHKEVLAAIQGGAVESIQLYGPIGHSTDFVTARVVFNYELGARGVYMRGQHPGIKIGGSRVRVWQVLEATYPRNESLEKDIFDNGFTRLLLIENAVEASLDKLPKKLARQIQAGFVVEIGNAYDGLPMIEFTSVAECSKALKQLINDPDFGGSRFDFEDDPCGDPY